MRTMEYIGAGEVESSPRGWAGFWLEMGIVC
jgi:hypothetical protein